ncbi:hypothetical protein [Dichotomicrobium thermohalophilum]|uniref:Uncharacterized protein n=1 Tax=Dichotomicrobium thermohalophilum TaxID=933063 RepID=A0A397Q832_9HYPH|nr:hypothetical protein [Dichotomicrobium thermohalophilum]RIA55985.1 hypothetical protein BXY53_1074 [Dichotomicrobium thermohalophilum]
MEQWNALGALANRVLRQAAEAREQTVSQLCEAEAAQGAAARERPNAWPAPNQRPVEAPRQLELPLV